MLQCPKCEAGIRLGWASYIRHGQKDRVTCDSCGRGWRLELPSLLRIALHTVIVSGVFCIGVVSIWLTPVRTLPGWLVFTLVAQVPWYLVIVLVSRTMDCWFGLLRPTENADNDDDPGHWVID